MSHSIAKLRQHGPMWYFERNYMALMELLEGLDPGLQERIEVVLPGGDIISFILLEQTRYTLLLHIGHRFSELEAVPAVRFDIRLYLDAKLAEVVSYQGVRYLKAKYPYPNKGMHQPDEKRQTNLMLYDWLCAISRLNFNRAIIKNTKLRKLPT